MRRIMMKSKIHRATVTEANVDYVGSVTIDRDLLEAADLLENERVQIVDNDNGTRLETYVIAGERGSGTIGINGGAARRIHPGDSVIIISYAHLDDAEAAAHEPTVVFVDRGNRVVRRGPEVAGAVA